MAKTVEYNLEDYTVEELKKLVADANAEIKAKVKEEKRQAKIAEAKARKEAKLAEAQKQKEIKRLEAVKLRDKLKIGSTANYAVKGVKASGTVILIGADKIKVEVNGKATTVNILNLV